jgi:N-methylhydantoinase A
VAAALGIIRIVNASMAKAIRAVSLEKGHDPKDFVLFGFGGASGLHCCELARELNIRKIVIPARAGILSAQGMVFAEPTRDYMQSLFLRGEELHGSILAETMDDLFARAAHDAHAFYPELEGNEIEISGKLNLRYQGQSYELAIPYEKNFIELFHRAHDHNFGYRLEDAPLELVSVQCSARVRRTRQPLPKQLRSSTAVSPVGEYIIYFNVSPENVPVFKRADLHVGATLEGPALIVDNYTTILLPGSFSLAVDELENLAITVPRHEDPGS